MPIQKLMYAVVALILTLTFAMPITGLADGPVAGSYPTLRFFRSEPSDSAAVLFEIPAGTQIVVTPVSGTDYASATYRGAQGYVKHVNFTPSVNQAAALDVSRLAPGEKDITAQKLELYIENATSLLSAADDGASEVVMIPPNTLATALTMNGAYYKISVKVLQGLLRKTFEGYVRASDVISAANPANNYYLYLTKANNTLTVYQANEKGKRTKEIIRVIVTALGKRSTPTPAGKFTIGARERWHKFNPSYAPFAIAYMSEKLFLHGPLYHEADEDDIYIEKVTDVGLNVTGGCLRMSYDDILWIYYHCAAGTTLEIVNGSK